MKNHTRLYFNAFSIDPYYDTPLCEICDKKANDIHHIDCKGMGGDPKKSKDRIENLMSVCRDCHISYGDKKQYMLFLYTKHMNYLQENNIKFSKNYFNQKLLLYE